MLELDVLHTEENKYTLTANGYRGVRFSSAGQVNK